MEKMPLLLRRGRVMEALGITNKQVAKFVAAGVLHPFKIKGARKFWYRRDEVLKLREEEKKK